MKTVIGFFGSRFVVWGGVTMSDRFLRTQMLLGEEAMVKLKNSHVAVFGVGGVGGYAVEALVRSGVGKIDVFDNDTVNITNINRQIIALESTIGKNKVDVIKERALQINPDVVINTYNCFYMPQNADEYDLSKYTYIIDAIDTVTAKIELVMRAHSMNIPIISSMGTGNKLDATKFEVSDIYKTSVCPLARTMRRELKSRGIKKLKVVYSREEPVKSGCIDKITQKPIPTSVAFVPPVAGMILAGEVIKDIID